LTNCTSIYLITCRGSLWGHRSHPYLSSLLP